MRSLTLNLTALTTVSFLAIACGPRAAVVVDERQTYVDEIADTICIEKDACGEIGEGEDYETMEDCNDSVESAMRDYWPADQCGDDAINGDLFLDCNDRARLNACDANPAEVFAALVECNADEVCID